ncbi:MAG: hypothetical protein EA001_04605 [Oscillatoriales cyanobacterium]|nr:MAG: hypothetical protein EA001_04605 [Oscillatoriales cyanobacterium]
MVWFGAIASRKHLLLRTNGSGSQGRSRAISHQPPIALERSGVGVRENQHQISTTGDVRFDQ